MDRGRSRATRAGPRQVSRIGRALMALTTPDPVEQKPGARLVIRVRSDGLTRGKAAAAAVHAALIHLGEHPGTPVIVLGANKAEIEAMPTVVRDAGRTEVEPGTVTAGAAWEPPRG